eukprot:scaffold5948_cov20-Tisochrysis_lutea.AAC.3
MLCASRYVNNNEVHHPTSACLFAPCISLSCTLAVEKCTQSWQGFGLFVYLNRTRPKLPATLELCKLNINETVKRLFVSWVEMQPSIQVLLNTVLFVSRNIITVSQAVPRVALQYTEKQARRGGTATCTPWTWFLLYWERKYQEPLWKVDKEGFIRRYEKASYALTRFDADILKYLQLQEEVQVPSGVLTQQLSCSFNATL